MSISQSSEAIKSYVNCGSLIGLDTIHLVETENCVLNCALLAQLHANKKANRFDDFQLWFRQYIETLQNVGWLIIKQDSGKIQGKSNYITMQEMILRAFQNIDSGSETVIANTINSFNDLNTHNEAKNVFEINARLISSDSSEQKKYVTCANFQVSYNYYSNNTVHMVLGCYSLISACNCKQLFSFNIPSNSSTIWQSVMVLSLNKNHYQRVEAKIEKAIKNEVTKYIYELPTL